MTLETHDGYEFEVFQTPGKIGEWNYYIFDKPELEFLDRFETEQEARFAAIGHITLLQN